jgi:hypothetical protein
LKRLTLGFATTVQALHMGDETDVKSLY